MNHTLFLGAVVILALMAGTANSQPAKPDFQALLTPKVIGEIHEWANNDVVKISIAAQNQRYADVDQARIDALDKQWRAERETNDKPLIAATLSSPLSTYLTRIQGRSIGLYAELFVMDDKGLNVGQSSITSDFWQGDEDKFLKTYAVSEDAVFMDEPEWDDDAKIWRGQVSFTLKDKAGKQKVGALTVEFNLTELQRRMAAGI